MPVEVDNDGSRVVNPRKKLEDEYLDIESKILTTLNIVDTMNKQFHIQKEGIFRKDKDKVTELLHAIEKIKEEFESIERPKLQIETPFEKSETPSNQIHPATPPPTKILPDKSKQDKKKHSTSFTMRTISLVELDKLSSDDDSAEEISEWEFDALDDRDTMS
ncbi:hypothetical protein TSUD_29290 [Trifolium subterraneum]|uniref:Uncharacterized protein n=1 Tax=Trifolium subterraneum TaxID=3900 RepID=A0A2Z6MQG8_TRISU|nr:hypothetical protein TSUD_29290 [Trifolium subterraneum]